MKKSLLIVVIVVAVVLAVPLLVVTGVVGLLAVAAFGGIGIGASESVAMIDDTPRTHTLARGPQWSSDRRYIVFEAHKEIYVVDPDGTNLQSISEGLGEDDFDFAPSLSPDGAQIVYTAVRHDRESTGWKRNSELIKSELDGSFRRKIGGGLEPVPVWSPKGDRLAYKSGGVIYTMASDGSDVRQVAGEETTSARSGSAFMISEPPVWSPNGGYMAFVARTRDYEDDDGNYAVYIIEADGSNLTELANTISRRTSGLYADDGRGVKAPTNQPAWSPDSRRLAFAKLESEGVKVYTVDPDGSNPREVFNLSAELGFDEPLGDSWHGNLSWSPDGSEILMGNVGGLDTWSDDGSWSFLTWRNFVIRSDGSEVRELPGPGGYASWSPDGTRIAIRPLSNLYPERDHGIELYTVARDGSDARVLVKRRFEKVPKKKMQHEIYETKWMLEAAKSEPIAKFPEPQWDEVIERQP